MGLDVKVTKDKIAAGKQHLVLSLVLPELRQYLQMKTIR